MKFEKQYWRDEPYDVAGRPAEGYCLRCQAPLNTFRDEQPRCLDCGLEYDSTDPSTFRRERAYSPWVYWFPGFCLSVASGVISYAVCLQSGDLGFAMFIAVPISIGAVLGYGTRAQGCLLGLLGLAAVVVTVFVLMSMQFAGFFCGLTLVVIFLLPAFVGVALGLLLRWILGHTNWDHRWFLPLLLILASPYLAQAIENLLPRRMELATVRTSLTVHATPRQAWQAIMFYEEVRHEPPALLRWGLPRPLRSVGDKSRVGEVVRCYYDRGYLSKRISRRVQDRLLAFDVIEQKLHFERDVTLRDGSFRLIPLGKDKTRIVLTTRYQRRLGPRWLWAPIERRVVATLHGHVLEGMRMELDGRPDPYEPMEPVPLAERSMNDK